MAKPIDKSCVIILGMHRSGTSALTRVISLLGCDLPKTLMVAHESNEAGHWESQAFANLNDEILDSAGSAWNDWTQCSPDWFGSLVSQKFVERAKNVFLEEYENSNFMVMKDPRNCRILPFWQNVLKELDIEASVIFPIRNPIEVADSHLKRDGYDQQFGLLLWLRHVLDAEFYSRGVKRVFTSYNELLENWGGLIEKTENTLGIKWPRKSTKVFDEIEGFLSKKHRHNNTDDSIINQNTKIAPWIKETYRIMQDWVKNGENSENFKKLDEIRLLLNEVTPAFAGLVSGAINYKVEASNANSRIQILGNQMIEKDALLVARDQDVARLSDEKSQLSSNNIEYERQLEEKNSEISRLIQNISVVEAEKLTHVNNNENLQNQLDVKNVQLTEAQESLHFMNSSLKQKEAEIDDVRKALIEKDDLLEKELHSNEELKEKLSDAEKANKDLNDELKDANLTNELLEEKLSDAEKANKDLNVELEAVKLSNDELNSKVENLVCELDRLRKDFEEKLKSSNAKITEKDNELNNLRQSLNHTETTKQNITNRLIEVQMLYDNANVARQVAQKSALDLIEQITHEERPFLSLKRSSIKRKANLLRNAGVVDEEWYLQQYPDVAATGMNATLHYVIHGKSEGRKPREK